MDNNKIANMILEYEMKFDGCFIHGYKTNEEFLNDLTKEIKTNGTEELLKCYKIYFNSMNNSMNNTNSTNKKRLALQNLISTLTNALIIP